MASDSGGSRADAARSRLVQAALESFAERGFHATTTRDLAAAAGMSPAAVYVHHRSKEDLLHFIAREGHKHVLDLLHDAIGSVETPPAQLTEAMRQFVTMHASEPLVVRVLNYELGALTPEHQEEISAIRRDIDTELRGVVERGIGAGFFSSPNPALTATALASLGIDLGRWYRPDRSWTPDVIADVYAELALRMVGLGAR